MKGSDIRNRFEAAARGAHRTLYPKVIKRFTKPIVDVFVGETPTSFNIYTKDEGRRDYMLTMPLKISIGDNCGGMTYIEVEFELIPAENAEKLDKVKHLFKFGIFWREERSWMFKKSAKVWAGDTQYFGERWFYWDKPLTKRFEAIGEKTIIALKLRD